MRKNYNGYLKPFLGRIKELHANKILPRQIAKILYREGVRSPYIGEYSGEAAELATVQTISGVVRHILDLKKARPSDIDKLKRRVKRLKNELRVAERLLAEANKKRRAERTPNREHS